MLHVYTWCNYTHTHSDNNNIIKAYATKTITTCMTQNIYCTSTVHVHVAKHVYKQIQ